MIHYLLRSSLKASGRYTSGMALLIAASVMASSLSSCSRQAKPTSGRPPQTAEIQWLGHQAFQIETSLGTKVLINPFQKGSVPHRLPAELKPDLLLITHEDRRVNNEEDLLGSPVILRGAVGLGSHSVRGIPVRGTRTGPERGSAPDNLVFSWQIDRMIFCHPGNLSEPLTAQQISEIGPVDVLFLPVSGPLSDTELVVLIEQLRPRIIIPMGSRSDLLAWSGGYPRVHRVVDSSTWLNARGLPRAPTAIVFSTP